MANTSNDEVISRASAHTIKKFELIEKYVQTWAQKLLNNQYCNGLVFIDCMCNSGEYYDDDGQQVFGTAVRVFKVLRDAAGQYANKQIDLYFNDIDANKVDHLKCCGAPVLAEPLCTANGGEKSTLSAKQTYFSPPFRHCQCS